MAHRSTQPAIKPCRACGRPMILRFNQHICVMTTLGERRYFHRSCVPFLFRSVDTDDLAA